MNLSVEEIFEVKNFIISRKFYANSIVTIIKEKYFTSDYISRDILNLTSLIKVFVVNHKLLF